MGCIRKIGLVTSFILLSFYSVVGGWIVVYLVQAISGGLANLTEAQYGQLFSELISSPFIAVGAQLLFILITIWVVARGIQNGIERANQIMMPALFISFLILIIRSLTLENSLEGVKFFLLPDFTAITSATILYALGQSFLH
ncbi:hypothetical protein ACI2OX_11605 [Bacillus sp. N9]